MTEKQEKLRAQSAARQANHRKRLAESGLSEVRGIFAPKEDHDRIRRDNIARQKKTP